MVRWYEREVELTKEFSMANVADLGLFDVENGKEILISELPVADLTNDEYVKLQNDPLLHEYSGSLGDVSSPKNQAFTILVTCQRLMKGHMKAGKNWPVPASTMMRWGIIRSGNLAMAIKNHLEGLSKKSKSSQGQTDGKPSGTPANTQT